MNLGHRLEFRRTFAPWFWHYSRNRIHPSLVGRTTLWVFPEDAWVRAVKHYHVDYSRLTGFSGEGIAQATIDTARAGR